eukprot:Amastigsp_a510841_157.p4 type:complete len:131 gc:universal Amastigsp_a510841_157:801-1193(+)
MDAEVDLHHVASSDELVDDALLAHERRVVSEACVARHACRKRNAFLDGFPVDFLRVHFAGELLDLAVALLADCRHTRAHNAERLDKRDGLLSDRPSSLEFGHDVGVVGRLVNNLLACSGGSVRSVVCHDE